MSLSPEFDVLPHGVVKIGDEVHAVFKMIVTIAKPSTAVKIDAAEWAALAEKVNGKWSWQFENAVLKVSNGSGSGPNINFNLRSAEGESLSSDSFHFGEEFVKDKDFFSSMLNQIINSRDTLVLSGPPITTAVRSERVTQEFGFEVRPGAISAAATNSRPEARPDVVYGPGYDTVLTKAEAFSKTLDAILPLTEGDVRTATDQGALDFERIYAGLMDEPLAAEIRYGLIREFRIPIRTLMKERAEVTYSFEILGTKGEMAFELRRRGDKYYNGLKKWYMTPGPEAHHDFQAVYVNYSDPYNNHLNSIEQRVSHPDGMYIIVKHKSKDGNIADPFERDFLRGFNVVVRSHDGKLYSLSLHNKVIQFHADRQRDRRNLKINNTSGILQPQADLMVTAEKGFRSNVLFAWRGDNLLVNRLIPAAENEGEFVCRPDDDAEGKFLNKRANAVESLVPDTQTQLITTDRNKSYVFIVRTVTPTGYCMPLRSEEAPEGALAIDDLDEAELDQYKLTSASFDINRLEEVPVKTISIIGPHEYKDQGSDFVDNAQHFVLNKLQGEGTEVRYIFPPFIKYEDFRYLGHLSQQQLRFSSDERLRPGQFVRRCISYEERSEVGSRVRVLPRRAPRIQRVNYLADPRADHLFFLPADLDTLSLFNGATTKAFEYSKNHPYYRDTYTCRLELSGTETGQSMVALEQKSADAVPVLDPIPDGLYAMRIYATDRSVPPGVTEIGNYNGTNINLSIVNKPEVPEMLPAPDNNVPERASRSDSFPNGWHYSFHVKKASRTWQSLKYLDTTKTLSLIQDKEQLERLLLMYPTDKPLLNDEYHYEMFLVESGDNDLKDSLYPEKIKLSFRAEANLKDVHETFFKLRLNQKTLLEVRLGEVIMIFLNDDAKPFAQFRYGGEAAIAIDFDPGTYKYRLTAGEAMTSLDDPISPTLSIRNVVIDDAILTHLALEKNDKGEKIHWIKFDRPEDYIILVGQSKPAAAEKRIHLFASSAFQAFFPGEKTELGLGTTGTSFSLHVPNNAKPTTPAPDCDILLFRRAEDLWRGDKIKQNETENIVRILLEEDFMKEGRNKVGIVLKKITNKERDDKQPELDPPSEVGEDLTKLTEMNWSGYDLSGVINFGHDERRLTKYFEESVRRYVEIDNETYDLLECTPYYNAHLRRWQILMPLKLRDSETLFIKIAVVKCAKGHGVRLKDPDVAESKTNPWVDKTGTNYSCISTPMQLPVYASKDVEVERSRVQGRFRYRVYNKTTSRHMSKVYYLAVKDKDASVLNVTSDTGGTLDSFETISYHLDAAGPGTGSGKILRTSLLQNIYVSLPNPVGKSLLVMEFELHNNAPSLEKPDDTATAADVPSLFPAIPRIESGKLRSKVSAARLSKIVASDNEKLAALPTEFVPYNPLFETKGIRLVDIAEINL